jgi:hypothetical protein
MASQTLTWLAVVGTKDRLAPWGQKQGHADDDCDLEMIEFDSEKS